MTLDIYRSATGATFAFDKSSPELGRSGCTFYSPDGVRFTALQVLGKTRHLTDWKITLRFANVYAGLTGVLVVCNNGTLTCDGQSFTRLEGTSIDLGAVTPLTRYSSVLFRTDGDRLLYSSYKKEGDHLFDWRIYVVATEGAETTGLLVPAADTRVTEGRRPVRGTFQSSEGTFYWSLGCAGGFMITQWCEPSIGIYDDDLDAYNVLETPQGTVIITEK